MAKTDANPLTDFQREIMEIVWAQGEVTVTEVRDALASKREVARNTVQTLIVRLEERGWLKHRQVGRTFFYSARISQNKSLGAKVGQLVDRMFGGSPAKLVNALIEHRGLSDLEAETIRQLIDQADCKQNDSTESRKNKK